MEKLRAAPADVAADEGQAEKSARTALDGDGPDVAVEDRAGAAPERDDTLTNAVRKADRRRRRHCTEAHQ